MSQPGTSKSKELKITSKQVVSKNAINEDPKKAKLLYIIKVVGPISERGLFSLIKDLQEKNVNLGYEFTEVAGKLTSITLREDITQLLYLGYVENDVNDKRLKITGDGDEALASVNIENEFASALSNAITELKTKIRAIDLEETEKIKRERRQRRR
ncbi:hypothetical protein HS7_17010 [Sulfolobales archaeon HS-7]|nr:hypothetical protein HS7_17010 [Sulfolobales archaeon HS-7]